MNSKWDYQTIGDVCTVERGGSPRPIDDYITESSDGINWIKIGDTDDSMYITKTVQKIRPEGMKKSRYVQPGDFLLSNSMSFGRPYILKIDGCIHDGWLVLRDNNNRFDKRFLYYYLSSKTTYQRFKAMAVGGVVNNLNSEMVRKVSVPIPCMNEQSEIADLLDSVNNVIQERNRELALFDHLIKARFVEFFGDPESAEKYPQIAIKDFTDVISGGTPDRKNNQYWENGTVPWVKTTELQNNRINSVEECITEKGLNESSAKVVPKNTVLIAMYGQGKTRGMTAILGIPASTNQACACILPCETVEPKYLWQYMIMSYDRLRNLAQGGNQPNLNGNMIKNFTVLVPPVKLQMQFVKFVEQVDKSKSVVQKALEEAQILFDSLMQGYFG